MTKSYGSDRRPQCFSSADVNGSPDVPRWLRPRDLRRSPALGAHCGATHPSPSRSGAAVAGGGPRAARASAATSCAATTRAPIAAPRCHADIHAAWRGSPMHLMTRLPARRRDPRALRRQPATFRFKDDTARLVDARRRALRRADVGAVRRSPLSRHARHRRPLPRGLRGRRGGRRATRASCCCRSRTCSRRAASASRATRCWWASARAAGGRRLERDLRLLPQHRPVLRRAVGRAGGAGRPDATRGRSSIACCRASGAGATTSTPGGEERCCGRARGRARWRAVGGTPPREGDDRRAALGHGIRELRSHFGARDFVEVGIGCEACHGGSREHVDDPRVHPDFAPRSPFLQARPRGGRRHHARRAGQPRLRALPPGAVLALSVHVGRGGAARRQAGRQHDHLGRGARLPARRLRAPDVVRDLPRSRTPRTAAPIWIGWRRPRATRSASAATRSTRRRPRWPRTPTTIRPAPARAASPATCRRRTWASATR